MDRFLNNFPFQLKSRIPLHLIEEAIYKTEKDGLTRFVYDKPFKRFSYEQIFLFEIRGNSIGHYSSEAKELFSYLQSNCLDSTLTLQPIQPRIQFSRVGTPKVSVGVRLGIRSPCSGLWSHKTFASFQILSDKKEVIFGSEFETVVRTNFLTPFIEMKINDLRKVEPSESLNVFYYTHSTFPDMENMTLSMVWNYTQYDKRCCDENARRLRNEKYQLFHRLTISDRTVASQKVEIDNLKEKEASSKAEIENLKERDLAQRAEIELLRKRVSRDEMSEKENYLLSRPPKKRLLK